MKDKVLFVVQRYGIDICGGSEAHCRQLAERMTKDYDVEVVTTTAKDDATWAPFYSIGFEFINQVYVRRFDVDILRDANADTETVRLADKQGVLIEDEIANVLRIGPYSQALIDYVRDRHKLCKAVIFVCYYYATTTIASLGINNAIIIPTLHDEYLSHFGFIKKWLQSQRYFIFNSKAEERLAIQLRGGRDNCISEIAGVGIDKYEGSSSVGIDDGYVKDFGEYILYLGRISEGKNCDQLLAFFESYIKKEPNRNVKLLLAGSLSLDVDKYQHAHYVGFVTDAEKNILLKNAKALVNPSTHESLSIVCLEALSVGVPIIVNRKCDATNDHLKATGCGASFEDFDGFRRAVNYVLDGKVNENCKKKGMAYVDNNYRWNVIIEKTKRMVELVASEKKCEIVEQKEMNAVIDENLKKTIVLAANDSYVKYLSVVISSVFMSNKNDRDIEFVIMSDGILDENKKKLIKQTSAFGGSARFVECGGELDLLMKGYKIDRKMRPTFLRFLIFKCLSNYEKVLYLDADVVVNDKIHKIFNTDLTTSFAAVVADPHIEVIRDTRPEVGKYLTEIGLSEDDKYFNAGVMLINPKLVSTKFRCTDFFAQLRKRQWIWHDQDVLNVLFRGRVKYLNPAWNFLWVDNHGLQNLMESSPLYFEAKKMPSILHYAGGTMPNKRNSIYGASEFWVAARNSLMYEDIIIEFIIDRVGKTAVAPNVNQVDMSFSRIAATNAKRTVNYFRRYGFSATLRRIAREFRKR